MLLYILSAHSPFFTQLPAQGQKETQGPTLCHSIIADTVIYCMNVMAKYHQ